VTALIFGDKIIYTCSKNAGSTIRAWVCDMIIMFQHDDLQIPSNPRAAICTPIPRPLVDRIQTKTSISEAKIMDIADRLGIQYHFGFEGTIEDLTPYCIQRDPIKRFNSCVSQKLHQPNFSAKLGSLENLVENFDDIVIRPLQEYRAEFSFNDRFSTWQELIVPRHFAPQTYTYGSDPGKFAQVFDIDDVSTKVRKLLENFLGRPLEVRHMNKRKHTNMISADLIPEIRNLYELDYAAGWGSI